jgi:hypothetical protein
MVPTAKFHGEWHTGHPKEVEKAGGAEAAGRSWQWTATRAVNEFVEPMQVMGRRPHSIDQAQHICKEYNHRD